MFLEVFPFCRLKVEPGVGERLNVGQESLDKWMELILETDTKQENLSTDKATLVKYNEMILKFETKHLKD